MPLQRVSQGFKDISMTFQRNPLNNDLIALKNITAITRSVRNIIFTYPGEKPFDPEFGSQVSRMLFENADPINSIRMKREIEYSINRYEPRVLLTSVVVNPNYDSNSYDVGINYNVIGIDVPTQNLEFVLQSTSQ
jgi:phage baseplate assembly protein W